LSEHLKCFCIRAHYERLKRHTLRMLGPHRNVEQVTGVTSSEKGTAERGKVTFVI
jgi:hypothetical protein